MDAVHPTAARPVQAMTTKKRAGFWLVLVAAACLVAYFAPSQEPGVVAQAPTAAKKNAPVAPPAPAGLAQSSQRASSAVLKIRPRDGDDEISGSFAAEQWTAPVKLAAAKAQPVVVVPEPPPQAPVLPFRFLGRYIEDGQTVVFLQNNEQNFAAKVGEVLQQTYQVQAITATAMTFVYLPLNQTQNLDIGALP